jgi:hypothetical protein
MTRKTSTVLAAALLVAGCSLSTDLPPLKPISIVTTRSVSDVQSPTLYVAKAYGYFFNERGFSYSDSRFASNTCVGPQSTTSAGSAPGQWLDPGQPTTFTLKGPDAQPRTVQMVKGSPDELDQNVYTNVVMPTLYPGHDSVTITVPGAAGGYPALTVSGKTVEDFTYEPVADSGTLTGGLAVRWSASTNANTAMEVALRYQTGASSSGINTQIVCTVVDDGDFSVPRQYLDGWQSAGEDNAPLPREIRYTRYLTSTATAGDAVILLINTLEKKQVK